MTKRTDIVQMGEDMGYAPEETLRQLAEVPARPVRQRRDVDRAARIANQHEAGNAGHRVPRVGGHAWACRECDFAV